jgi:hypothetical protein
MVWGKMVKIRNEQVYSSQLIQWSLEREIKQVLQELMLEPAK